MKFSIITPVYNSEKYLPDCIESVINQTYPNWELILVDDGSTDSSGRICDEYAKKDSRIIVVHKENSGAYQTRLEGNKYITGDYTIGLDSDDMYEPNCLELVNAVIEKKHVDMVGFGMCWLHEKTQEKEDIPYLYDTDKVLNKEQVLLSVASYLDHSLWNKAIKSDCYKMAKYLPEDRKIGIDLDFYQLIPILCQVESAYCIDVKPYIYRVYEDSISHRVKEKSLVDIDWIHCRLHECIGNEGLMNDDLDMALQKSYSRVVRPRIFELVKQNGMKSFLHSELNSLEYMKRVYENRKIIPLKKKEAVVYKEAIKGRIIWGIIKSHFV